jgi:ABC-type amino acid transport system permease subunit
MKSRVNLIVGLGITFATLIGSILALSLYAERPPPMGPLEVRTDLMRGMPCHVADATIMGDCSEEEVARFQREAQ